MAVKVRHAFKDTNKIEQDNLSLAINICRMLSQMDEMRIDELVGAFLEYTCRIITKCIINLAKPLSQSLVLRIWFYRSL